MYLQGNIYKSISENNNWVNKIPDIVQVFLRWEINFLQNWRAIDFKFNKFVQKGYRYKEILVTQGKIYSKVTNGRYLVAADYFI